MIDLFSRRVICCSMQGRTYADLPLQALLMAVWRCKPKAKVHVHSDQGSQFTSYEWQEFLEQHNLTQSMSRRGNCWDNAVAESFFNLLKRERIRRRKYKLLVLPVDRPTPRQTEDTLDKALARAFRWKRMLEAGDFTTIAELAEREGIAPSCIARVLRLTLLAPAVIDAFLDGRKYQDVTLAKVLGAFSTEWADQMPMMAA